MNAIIQNSHVTQILNDLQVVGGFKGTDIANFVDVSKATVSRWTHSTRVPHPKTQMVLSDLHYVVMRLQEYYSANEIRNWLYARHPQLEGERAIDLVSQNRSEQVLGILDRLDDDAYI